MTSQPSPLTKGEARAAAYRGLHEAKAARFPFPIEGRIPNFKGAEKAARILRTLPIYQRAQLIKVNPDAPQRPIRAMALADGKSILVPAPRLRAGFWLVTPQDVPPGEEHKAASLSHIHRYGREIDLDALRALVTSDPGIGLIVAGSVAVSRQGARAGKGEGYADMEYALLRELGLNETPVVTTVHPAQIVHDFPVDSHDLSVDIIVTPHEAIETHTPYPKPSGIDWNLLTSEDLEAMPVLARWRGRRWESLTTPDIVAPGLRILFVGINPGKKSAAVGHNFAGPGNHFWRLLYDAGLTPVKYRPDEEGKLLEHGLGITNVVSRASRSEADLSWKELSEGGRALREKVAALRPRIVALLGKNVYRAYANLRPSSPVAWGVQPRPVVPGSIDFVAPNPSARSTLSYGQRLELFRSLKALSSSQDNA
jgi:5-formyltetrahydrofolate cyclo-ligase